MHLLPTERPFSERATISGNRQIVVLFAKKPNGTARLCGWSIGTNLTGSAKKIYALWRKELDQQPADLANTLTTQELEVLKKLLCKYV